MFFFGFWLVRKVRQIMVKHNGRKTARSGGLDVGHRVRFLSGSMAKTMENSTCFLQP